MFGLFKKKEKKIILTVDRCSLINESTLEVGVVNGTVYKPNGWTGFKLITNDGVDFANVYSENGINSTRWYADMDLHGKEFTAKVELLNPKHPEYGLICQEINIFG